MRCTNRYKIIISLLLFILLIHTITLADELNVIHVNKNTTKLNLYESIDIFEDKGNTLTIDDVSKEEYSQAFQSTAITGNSFGVTDSSFWVRFSIRVDVEVTDTLYLEIAFPLIDKITLYIPDEFEKFHPNESGETNTLALKDVDYRNSLFSIPKNTKVRTYYMHLEGKSSIQIPMYLFTSSAFIEHVDKSNFILGGYYGNMVLLMVIALIAFFKIRESIFLLYSIYLFSYLFFQLSVNGFFVQYFSPLSVEYANNTTLASLALVVVGATLFSGSFLKIWEGDYPKIRVLFYLLIISAVLGNVIAYTFNYAIGVRISTIAGVMLPPTVLFAAIYTWYHGFEPAKYFLVAWGIFLFGIFLSGLLFLGIVPHTFITAYSMQIGSTFELLLVGYALIDRINTLYDEKEEATKNSNVYLEQINEGLESLVSQRTKELEEKNTLLLELNTKDSMTGLLNHNASLDQLKAMKDTASRHGYALSVLMIDIDLFKGINDKYGHISGDQVIKKIVGVIKDNIRPSDFAGRYGGEEFIVMLHETDAKSATKLAERMREDIESLKIPQIKNETVTASFGVSIFDSSKPHADIISYADKALYKAKQSGRNKVYLY